MSFILNIKKAGVEAIKELYEVDVNPNELLVNETKSEFEGDYTLVIFPLLKRLRQKPEVAGERVGEFLLREYADLFCSFNVIKGFLNLSIANPALGAFLQ
ncbi:MAG TPA: hypothetical protein VK084_01205, partial [Chitinophagaceae bacterium]|nr:hypothetical protein [Chitinophagaceae bacterium]